MSNVPASHPLAVSSEFRHHKGRHFVFRVSPCLDFAPTDPGDVPDGFSNVEVFDVRLSMCQAIAAVRHYNREQLATGQGNRSWAVMIFRPKRTKGGAK